MALLIAQGENAPQRYPLFKQITRIGSDPESDIHLNSESVHPEHAHLLREDDAYVLSSVGRGRPIKVNGKKGKRFTLSDGDEVTVGDVSCTYYEHAPPAETATGSSQVSMKAYQEMVVLSEKLLRSGDVVGLLEATLDAVVELTRADKGFVVLLQDGEPEVRVARNVQRENIDDAITELSDSIIAKVVREQEPIIVSDALNDAEFKASRSVMNLRLCSVMCVPLTDGESLVGILYLGSNRIANLFEPEQLEVVRVFAAQASLLLRQALAMEDLQTRHAQLLKQSGDAQFGSIIGPSALMQEVFATVRKVAPTDVSVLVTGETGTGKELIAKEIHKRSSRTEGPFVVVNCGAIPENLLESELFGHVRGAFTGAVATRDGRFQQAHQGTLFLDEIGELPLPLQVKLLRALQERTVTKVGHHAAEEVDIRVVAATHRDLEAMIREGTFREDLYYRLNVISIVLPPLRERGEDLMVIARYLVHKYAAEYHSKVKGFSPQCAMMMKKFPWAGNVRQLENRIKKAVIMAEGQQLTPADLELSDEHLAPVRPLSEAKEEFQRQYINEVLARNNGNRTKTAQDLGVDPRTIFRHLEREEAQRQEQPS